MRWFLTLTPFVLLCCFGSLTLAGDSLHGHSVNALGRWTGYGWSRGYHSQDGCQSNSCQSNQCLGNTPVGTEEGSFMPTYTPAPDMPPAKPAGTPTAPTTKSGMPTLNPLAPKVEPPRADDSRWQRRVNYPLRAQHYPLDAISR